MPINPIEMKRREAEKAANEARATRVLKSKARAAWSGDDASFEEAFPEILKQLRMAEVVNAVGTRTPGASLD